LYPGKRNIKIFKNNLKAVPGCNKCFIKLLNIKNKKILKVFNEWETPKKTAKLANEIFKKGIGGHLTADITYTFWKYADFANDLKGQTNLINNKVLLEQAIVAVCTAYEYFLKEMIPWVLKNNKDAAKRFLGRIDKPIKTLGKYGFDILGNVDKIFFELYRDKLFPIFPDVYKFYKEIFRIDLFSSKKEKKYIEFIFEIRHCIVHNEGKPDKRYFQKTGKKKLIINQSTTRKYCIKIDEKLHDVSSQIFTYMNLNPDKTPWRKIEEEMKEIKKDGMYLGKGKWKYIQKKH
jgi:hypothetical protein